MPADLLASIGCYWTAMDATVYLLHKADNGKVSNAAKFSPVINS